MRPCEFLLRRCSPWALPGVLQAHRTIRTQTIKLVVPFVPAGRSMRWPAWSPSTCRAGSARTSSSRTGPAAAPPSAPRRSRRRRPTATRCSSSVRTSPITRCCFPISISIRSRALAPVATLVTWSHVIAVAPSVPANTIAELVAHAKANPGKLAFGFGLATMPHIIGEKFKQASGHRHHRRALSRRRAGARRSARRARAHQHRAGAATAAAYPRRQDPGTGLHRAEAQPRSARRSDHDRERLSAGRLRSRRLDGVLAPAGTPCRDRRRLNAAINEVLASAEMAPALKLGYEAKITTPEEFAAFFAAELKKWPPLLQAAGLKPQ